MNKLAKPLVIGATVLYTLGVFFTAWYLIALPEYLMKASKAIDLDAAAEIRPLHLQILLVACSTLMLGLVALFLQMVTAKKQEENIVYVEREKDTKHTSAKLDEDDTESYNVSAISEELLGSIRQAASSGEHADKKLEKALRAICNQLHASQGAVYISVEQGGIRNLELRAGYALMKPDSKILRYEYGEGLPGQVAKEGQLLNLNKVPDGYIKVLSGLGSATPNHLLLVPIQIQERVAGVVEVASFTPLLRQHEELVKQSFEIMAKVIEESSLQAAAPVERPEEEEDLINQPVKR